MIADECKTFSKIFSKPINNVSSLFSSETQVTFIGEQHIDPNKLVAQKVLLDEWLQIHSHKKMCLFIELSHNFQFLIDDELSNTSNAQSLAELIAYHSLVTHGGNIIDNIHEYNAHKAELLSWTELIKYSQEKNINVKAFDIDFSSKINNTSETFIKRNNFMRSSIDNAFASGECEAAITINGISHIMYDSYDEDGVKPIQYNSSLSHRVIALLSKEFVENILPPKGCKLAITKNLDSSINVYPGPIESQSTLMPAMYEEAKLRFTKLRPFRIEGSLLTYQDL